MSVFISVGILILAMLIMAFLQLIPGVFALFSHYALGKFSKAKAYDLMLFFIIGVETINVCLFLSIYYLTYVFNFGDFDVFHSCFTWIIVGVMTGLSFASLFFYFRNDKGTKLFISRKYASALNYSSKNIKSRSDAFSLGAVSGTYELLFTIPLYIIVSLIITRFIPSYAGITAFIFIIMPLISLFCIYACYRTRHNLADIIKSRRENKNFIRFLLCFSYLLIAILITYIGVN